MSKIARFKCCKIKGQFKWWWFANLIILMSNIARFKCCKNKAWLKWWWFANLMIILRTFHSYSTNLLRWIRSLFFFFRSFILVNCVKMKFLEFVIPMLFHLQGNDYCICHSWPNLSLCWWNPSIQVISLCFSFFIISCSHIGDNYKIIYFFIVRKNSRILWVFFFSFQFSLEGCSSLFTK